MAGSPSASRFPSPFRGVSLRWKVPLFITLLVAAVVATLVAVAYREVRQAQLRLAGLRAQSAANQIAGMLARSTEQRLVEGQRFVNRSTALADCLLTRTAGACDSARVQLKTLASPAQQVVELWSARGERVLTIATPSGAEQSLPSGSPPIAAGVGRLQRNGDVLFANTIWAISSALGRDDASQESQDVRPAGFVVVRRPVSSAAPTRDLLNRLLGDDGSISLGNAADQVWTNLATATAPPPVDLTQPGVQSYVDPSGNPHLGAVSPIGGTPWVIWVEFPYRAIVAPANAFLGRMSGIAFVFMALACAGAVVIGRQITVPLRDLTDVSEAIASGDYSRRIAVRRQDEIGRLGQAFNLMAMAVHSAYQHLEGMVAERTAGLEAARGQLEQHVKELAAVNRELEAFSYSVSHDLRAPVRHITGFAALLEQCAGDRLGDEGRRHLSKITGAATAMGRLIDDLLAFSRVSRTPLVKSRVDLNHLVQEARQDVTVEANGRAISWTCETLPVVDADPALLRLAFVNLLSNALKYSSTRARSEVTVGVAPEKDETVIFVRDNGVGFDPSYAHKLFGVFQRLHTSEEFEGTGIGLANVRRIIQRHGGRTWAEGRPDGGATFYISLPREAA